MKTRHSPTRRHGKAHPDSIGRTVISVHGVVQGVGFRPFVYQLVTRHGLQGWVRNTSEGVRIDVEGNAAALDRFLVELQTSAPPLARIQGISASREPVVGHQGFAILESTAEEGKYQLVSPDIATCPACLEELLSPDDRRYRYPFINCTDCGPRFTIIEDIPYDRPRTTMARFKMCPRCQQEYDDPLNRRFHAQPNACPECGPSLKLLDSGGSAVSKGDVLSAASRLLKQGTIIAIKGLGGFLLACDATNEEALQLLRQRKRRPSKPFAIMLTSLEEAREHCEVSLAEEGLLSSHQNPIVLLKRRPDSSIAPSVAPGLDHLGVRREQRPNVEGARRGERVRDPAPERPVERGDLGLRDGAYCELGGPNAERVDGDHHVVGDDGRREHAALA